MAESDHDDGREVTERTPAVPVRSAPMRRARRGKPAGPAPTSGGDGVRGGDDAAGVDGGGVAVEDAAVPVDDGVAALDDAPVPAGGAGVAGGEAEPDPSDVEQTLSYRDRRRARLASDETAVPQTDSGAGVRYAGRGGSARWWLAGAVAVVLIVACVAASVAFAVGIGRADRQSDLRAEYSAFAQQMIVDLTTLSPQNVDTAMKTLQDKTSGRALEQMQQSMKQAVGLVQDEKVDTKTTVISDAVTKADPNEGTVILVFGWQMKTPDPKVPIQIQTFRWRVQLTRINGDLKMTNFEWVT